MSLRLLKPVAIAALSVLTACGQRSDEPEDRGRVSQVERSALRAERPWEPGVVLVKPLRAGPAAGGGRALAASLQLDHLSGPGKTGVHRMRIRGEQDARQAAARLARHPQLAYAEPNYRIELAAVPDDLYFDDCWGLHNSGQFGGTPDADIDAPEAWDLCTGSEQVVVAVIDTGIDLDHPDLIDNIWTNPDEIADNGLDDDGNGYIDDVHGWSFVDDSNDVQDSHGHGTACAGAIGAVGDNGLGVAGVAWNVQIMPIRFRTYGNDPDYEETYTLDAAEAIYYAVDEGARVTSNSWTSWYPSQTLYDAVSYADQNEVLIIAAAGNGGSDIEHPWINGFPAEWDHDCVISVAATDDEDRLTWWTNRGPHAVDLAAPGDQIRTTSNDYGYVYAGGTSLSTPFVAGTAALLLSLEPEASLHDIRHSLLATVDPIPEPNGWSTSDGRLNAHRALQAIKGEPLPPRAHAGADRVVVTREPVQLDGTGSVDPNRDAISYHWELSPPALSAAVLDDATSATPTFLADKCGSYTATLVVTDAGGLQSQPNQVHITVMNRMPLAAPIETPHPYPDDWDETWKISHPGASAMGVHFSDIVLEPGHDWIVILDGQEEVIDQITGYAADHDVAGVAGDELNIRIITDDSGQRPGFVADAYWWCAGDDCPAGSGDCNGDPADGCETDVTTDVANCGWCGRACALPNAVAGCIDGRCAIANCNAGFIDCDGDPANGCEAQPQTDPANCGGCGQNCLPAPHALPACVAGDCRLGDCHPGWADCNGDPADGCEIDTVFDPAHCGGCDSACDLPHAEHAYCELSSCLVGDCQTWAEDVESEHPYPVYTQQEWLIEHPGAAGIQLHFAAFHLEDSYDFLELYDSDGALVASYTGDMGAFLTEEVPGDSVRLVLDSDYSVTEFGFSIDWSRSCDAAGCAAGFSDCDGRDSNGCEAELDSDAAHCGACGHSCVGIYPNATGVCVTGVCDMGDCRSGFFDCNQQIDDGCEIDGRLDEANCGGCGVICQLDHASAECLNGDCLLDTCDAGFADCNADAADGCEAELANDPAHCGGCDQACLYPHAEGLCNDGVCSMGECQDGFGDCNRDADDGCEVDLMHAMEHCGGCGQVCDRPHASGDCQSGSCMIAACDTGWADCNADTTDGCETNTDSNEANCGGCGESCADGSRCVDGVCNCPDADGDGDAAAVCGGGDCDDADPAVHSAAAEDCDNAIDDNCDGRTNEGCQMPDDGGDGGCGCGPTRPGHPAAGLLAGLALLLALLSRRRING